MKPFPQKRLLMLLAWIVTFTIVTWACRYDAFLARCAALIGSLGATGIIIEALLHTDP